MLQFKVLLLRKLYLYLTKDPEAVHYFLGGGVHIFFQGGGPNANFYRNTYTYLLSSRGCVWTPYPPLDPHMGNVIITGQYLCVCIPACMYVAYFLTFYNLLMNTVWIHQLIERMVEIYT